MANSELLILDWSLIRLDVNSFIKMRIMLSEYYQKLKLIDTRFQVRFKSQFYDEKDFNSYNC